MEANGSSLGKKGVYIEPEFSLWCVKQKAALRSSSGGKGKVSGAKSDMRKQDELDLFDSQSALDLMVDSVQKGLAVRFKIDQSRRNPKDGDENGKRYGRFDK